MSVPLGPATTTAKLHCDNTTEQLLQSIVFVTVVPVTVHTTSLKAKHSACSAHHRYTRIKNITNVTRCRDSRSAKSIETR